MLVEMIGVSVSSQIPRNDNASYSVALSKFAAAVAVLTSLLTATITLVTMRLSASGRCRGQNSGGGVASLRRKRSSSAATRPVICRHLKGLECFHCSSSLIATGWKVRPVKLHSVAAS